MLSKKPQASAAVAADSILAVGVPGPGRSSLGPSSYPYSPECVEGEFSEIHIQDTV